jgi:hypothetical protein
VCVCVCVCVAVARPTSSALLNILSSISAIILICYAVLYLNCSLHLFSVSMSVKPIIPVPCREYDTGKQKQSVSGLLYADVY